MVQTEITMSLYNVNSFYIIFLSLIFLKIYFNLVPQILMLKMLKFQRQSCPGEKKTIDSMMYTFSWLIRPARLINCL